jgi:hypothetical protein
LPLASGWGSVKSLGGGGAEALGGTVPVLFGSLGVLVFDEPPEDPPLLDEPSLRDEPSDVSAFADDPSFESVFDEEDPSLFEEDEDDPLPAHAPSESSNTPSRAMSARRTPTG